MDPIQNKQMDRQHSTLYTRTLVPDKRRLWVATIAIIAIGIVVIMIGNTQDVVAHDLDKAQSIQ